MAKRNTQNNYPENKIYHLVYLTTNLINQKIYIGVHSTNDIDDGYLGSGVGITNAVTKYGKENFTKCILYYCLTRDDAFDIERVIVSRNFIRRNISYNQFPGGKSGNIKYTDEVISKMKVSTPARKAFSDSIRGMTLEEILGETKAKESKQKNRDAHLGKKPSEEALARITESNRNKRLGKSYNEIYGENVANSILQKQTGQKRTKEQCNNIKKGQQIVFNERRRVKQEKLEQENSIQYRATIRELSNDEILEWINTRVNNNLVVSRTESLILTLPFVQNAITRLVPFVSNSICWVEKIYYIIRNISAQKLCPTCGNPVVLKRIYCHKNCVDSGAGTRGKTAKEMNIDYSKRVRGKNLINR